MFVEWGHCQVCEEADTVRKFRGGKRAGCNACGAKFDLGFAPFMKRNGRDITKAVIAAPFVWLFVCFFITAAHIIGR